MYTFLTHMNKGSIAEHYFHTVLQGDLLCSLLNGQGEAERRAGARLHPGAHGVGWDGR